LVCSNKSQRGKRSRDKAGKLLILAKTPQSPDGGRIVQILADCQFTHFKNRDSGKPKIHDPQTKIRNKIVA